VSNLITMIYCVKRGDVPVQIEIQLAGRNDCERTAAGTEKKETGNPEGGFGEKTPKSGDPGGRETSAKTSVDGRKRNHTYDPV